MKKLKLITVVIILFSAFIIPASSNAQIISTFAGNGIVGHTGDGGQATAAAVGTPGSVAIDNFGNVYITASPSCIRMVTPAGIITTIAGSDSAGYSGDGGPATNARIGAAGVAIDRLGNLYIVDYLNSCVRMVNPSGIISTCAGTPHVLGDYGDGGPATEAMLNYPGAIAVDYRGNLYIADVYNYKIRKVSGGFITTIAGTGIQCFLCTGDGGPATDAMLSLPMGVAADSIGNVYITDLQVLRKVDTTGIITTVAGSYGAGGYSGDGGPATAAHLVEPYGVAVDNRGNIFLTDLHNNVVRSINTAGFIFTYVGNHTSGFSGDGGPANFAQLNTPRGVAVDPSGALYIADVYNNRVRKVTASTAVPSVNNSPPISISPNPATDIVRITSCAKVTVKLYNTLGKLVAQAANTDQISVSALPPGIFFIRLFGSSNELVYQGKILKE
jgi:Secretion system C-terminal sorting domain/NHL repeat